MEDEFRQAGRFRLRAILSVALALAFAASTAVAAEAGAGTSGRAESLRKTLEALTKPRSRTTGSPGAAAARDYIIQELKACGLEPVVESFTTAMPVQDSAYIEIEGAGKFPLEALWPNLTRTSTVSREGLRGHLVYAGRGDYADFKGLDMEGAIVLMDFNSEDNMINARIVGAEAVIFIEPKDASRAEAERKWLASPTDLPRFWVSADDGFVLQRLAERYARARRRAAEPFVNELEARRRRLGQALDGLQAAQAEEREGSARLKAAAAKAQEARAALEAHRVLLGAALAQVHQEKAAIHAEIKWRELKGDNVWALMPGSDESAWAPRYSAALQALEQSIRGEAKAVSPVEVLLRSAERLVDANAPKPRDGADLAWREKVDVWARAASAARAALKQQDKAAAPGAGMAPGEKEKDLARVEKPLERLRRLAVRPLCRRDEDWRVEFAAALGEVLAVTARWPEAVPIAFAAETLDARAADKPKHQVVVLQAYYDSISVVATLAPGAEQACGIAALLQLVREMSAAPPRRTVLVLATSGHAQLLSGMSSWLYAHALDEKTLKRLTEDAFRRLIKEGEPIVFDLLVGLDLSSGSRRLGVFFKGHMGNYLTYLPEQAQAFYRDFSDLLCRFGRELSAEEDMAKLDAAARAAGEQPLAGKPREVALAIFQREDTFTLDNLAERLAKTGATRADVESSVQALRRHGLVVVRDAPKPKDQEAAPAPVAPAGPWAGKEIVYDADPRLQNGVTPIRGIVWTSLLPGYFSFDSEACAFLGLPGIALATINDARRRVDTPHDLVKHVDLEALEEQVESLSGILGRALNSTKRYSESKAKITSLLHSFRGQITEFRIGKSILADFPVPDVVVAAFSKRMGIQADIYKTMTGVRTIPVAISDATGHYYMPQMYFRDVLVEPLRFDEDTGRILYAADQGSQGATQYSLSIGMDQVQKKWRNVVFRCEALDLYGADDPRYLQLLNQVAVLGPLDFAPERYGYSAPTGRAETIYFEPGRRVKVIMGSGVFGKQYLLTNAVSDADVQAGKAKAPNPTGIGYTNRDDAGNLRAAILYTPERVVRDTLVLNDSRMRRLRAYGIENQLLSRLQAAAVQNYERAVEARRDGLYDAYADHIRAARGFAARAYPDVRGTSTDTIKGLVFYFALLLPFSVFCERLLFAFADIRKRIAGVCSVFVLVFVIMYFAHPAFRISQNPWIIFVAFVLLAMSAFVIAIVVNKFNEQVAQMRRSTAQVHETDVGRISASVAAFSLGINNMRKRRTRTLLTTATLVLLMFTVLSFTSVETYTRFNEILVPKAVATYAGALLRDRNWNPMLDIAWRYCASAFGPAMGPLIPRAWYVSPDRDNELDARIERADGSRSTYVKAAVGFTAQERLATGLHKALVAGDWFGAPDEDTCILTRGMAERLGIDPAKEVSAGDPGGNPRVRVFGRVLRVRGVVDSKLVDAVTDLDSGNITPVDTTDIAARGTYGQQETVASVRENPTELGVFKHMSSENVVFLPFDLVRDVGGALRSIALVRPQAMTQESFVQHIKDFMNRVGMTIFVSDPKANSVTALSSLALSSFGGLQGLFIPIAIAALIVLNTMMGSVYERFREIGIYSSVGLAPIHVAALFMAESCVYAVLGAIAGYLIGQVVGTALFNLRWLSGLTLNYTSLSAVLSTLIVMAVVLLSTLYPSKVASDMAVPDVTRRWRFPEPEGDDWYFDFPFTVASAHALGLYVFLNHYFEGYTEESVGSFYTEGVSFSSFEGEHGTGYMLKMMVWIAPFDMGVSQGVEMRAVQTEDEGIARIQLYIRRETGEVAAWRRLNKGFLTDIRKQFLLWRTVPKDVKMRYIQEGRETLAAPAAAPRA